MPLYLLDRIRALFTPISFTPPCANPDLSYGIGIKVGTHRVRHVFHFPHFPRHEQIEAVRTKIHVQTGRLYTHRRIAKLWPSAAP